ncbi:hypothetical protein EYF80_017557 [Liparis tanakae]|uniref:Uncharacterized protein n=1 Tax=Liparis tanakae TaxID=230148 RepID=A0A4Z2I4W2_9TELE|nr:hypothetical protein EYF80_017557 [Liparis tanakae]
MNTNIDRDIPYKSKVHRKEDGLDAVSEAFSPRRCIGVSAAMDSRPRCPSRTVTAELSKRHEGLLFMRNRGLERIIVYALDYRACTPAQPPQLYANSSFRIRLVSYHLISVLFNKPITSTQPCYYLSCFTEQLIGFVVKSPGCHDNKLGCHAGISPLSYLVCTATSRPYRIPDFTGKVVSVRQNRTPVKGGIVVETSSGPTKVSQFNVTYGRQESNFDTADSSASRRYPPRRRDLPEVPVTITEQSGRFCHGYTTGSEVQKLMRRGIET